jgi:lactoylglutathione lyase/methylmalonyl-CoA/ethylmalonyl-CoA epimerase
MVLKIEHIGIVVKDLETTVKKYSSLLGLEVKEVEEIKMGDISSRVAFVPVGESNLELIEATSKSGPIADFLRERGEGLHHMALEVEDLEKTFKQLRSQGVEFVWDRITKGSRGTEYVVIKANELGGVHVELVQKH